MDKLYSRLGHAVRIEEVSGDQEKIRTLLNDPIDHFLKRVLNARAVIFPFLASAKGVALQMHIGGMNDFDASAWHVSFLKDVGAKHSRSLARVALVSHRANASPLPFPRQYDGSLPRCEPGALVVLHP